MFWCDFLTEIGREAGVGCEIAKMRVGGVIGVIGKCWGGIFAAGGGCVWGAKERVSKDGPFSGRGVNKSR